MIVIVSMFPAVGRTAEPCPELETIDLITGASSTGVVGIAEYEVIATNRMSLGTSVAAITRIWGGVTVDRWLVHTTAPCVDAPTAEVGDRFFVLVGLETPDERPVYGLPASGILSDLESGALAAIVGEPVRLDIGAVDRSMAWMRVNWLLIAIASVVVIAIVAVIRYRASNARRDYLF